MYRYSRREDIKSDFATGLFNLDNVKKRNMGNILWPFSPAPKNNVSNNPIAELENIVNQSNLNTSNPQVVNQSGLDSTRLQELVRRSLDNTKLQESSRFGLNNSRFQESGLDSTKLQELVRRGLDNTKLQESGLFGLNNSRFQESGIDNSKVEEFVRRGLDNTKLYDIDHRRYIFQREHKRRQDDLKKYNIAAAFHEQARIQSEIRYEENARLRSQPGYLILDIPKTRESFPELPPEALALVKSAWNKNADEDEVFVDAQSLKMKRKDLITLSGLNWLNDEVINFYLDMVVQRSQDDDSLPKVYAFQTFFYTTLKQRGYAGVKRWTRKVDLTEFDLWIVPVHLTNHWCMAIVDVKEEKIEYYDSMLGTNSQVFTLLKNYIVQEMADKKKVTIDTEGWQCDRRSDIPTQHNGSDCGMFACKFAEYASRRAPVDFNQSHMPYFRKRTTWEICQTSLM